VKFRYSVEMHAWQPVVRDTGRAQLYATRRYDSKHEGYIE